MQTVEIGADTKSCQDISRLFKDYLVFLRHAHIDANLCYQHVTNIMMTVIPN